MSKPAVTLTEDDGVLVVVLDRPEAHNAINAEVAEALGRAMDLLDAREDLRVGVLTGAGGAFSAGMDLKAFLAGEQVVLDRGFAGMCTRPTAKPLLAAVEGWALAGGCEIALACDIVVAAEDARFGLPETRRGLIAAAGGLLRLPRRITPGAAKLMALTGVPVAGVEAHRLGLVDVLVEPGTALERAVELAREIAANAPLAVVASKDLIDSAADRPVVDGFAHQAALADRIAASDDAREGAEAFVAKRDPAWTGR
ncbi:crotonase/enoyl-CoA hydratase family protein [Dactylosporangium sp. CA-233914]|uniref:crotonase/enoyl-CoA hydratase family protein n=1 Tax=Dactylosporangium sp. CA-233914 TaxID=3239934 RepID=UPI003D8A963B